MAKRTTWGGETERPLVLIRWHDAAIPLVGPPWRHTSTIADAQPEQCSTAGWLVDADDVRFVVGQSIGSNADELASWMIIPTGCVESVHYLTLGRAVRKGTL